MNTTTSDKCANELLLLATSEANASFPNVYATRWHTMTQDNWLSYTDR